MERLYKQLDDEAYLTAWSTSSQRATTTGWFRVRPHPRTGRSEQPAPGAAGGLPGQDREDVQLRPTQRRTARSRSTTRECRRSRAARHGQALPAAVGLRVRVQSRRPRSHADDHFARFLTGHYVMRSLGHDATFLPSAGPTATVTSTMTSSASCSGRMANNRCSTPATSPTTTLAGAMSRHLRAQHRDGRWSGQRRGGQRSTYFGPGPGRNRTRPRRPLGQHSRGRLRKRRALGWLRATPP